MAHKKYAQHVAVLHRCADVCDHCSVACLGESNVADMARCIRLDLDCAAICRFTAGALARDSESVGAIARLCAELCESCGEECGKHEHEHCKECAEACRECARQCRELAA